MVARVADVPRGPGIPDGASLRETRARRDLDRIEALENEVWGHEGTRLADRLEAELGPRGGRPSERGRRGRAEARLRRLASAGVGVRDPVGRRHVTELAPTRYLQRARFLQGPPRRAGGVALSGGRRLRRQPPDPRATRVEALTTRTPYVWSPGRDGKEPPVGEATLSLPGRRPD